MSGDETEKVPDSTKDAATAAPGPVQAEPAAGGAGGAGLAGAAGGAAVELSAAEQAVSDFEVPEPPSFGDAGDLPVPAAVVEEPVIPPPPVFDEDRDAAATASTVEEKLAARRAAQLAQTAGPAGPVTYVEAPSQTQGTADTTSYRGWTIAIYSGLAVLLVGAIGFLFVLGVPG